MDMIYHLLEERYILAYTLLLNYSLTIMRLAHLK